LNQIGQLFNLALIAENFKVVLTGTPHGRIGAFLACGKATELTMFAVNDFASQLVSFGETFFCERAAMARRQ
jgi:hypothetical protein